MFREVGGSRDGAEDRLYSLAESQGGYLTAQQAIQAGIPRSTLSYHAGDGGTLSRVGHGVYRLRRFPGSPHEHVIPAWLGLSRADAVVSGISALELLELTDLIADDVHVTLPRSKRGSTIPPGVRAHFTSRPIALEDRRSVAGMPVTGVERTIADVLRWAGWTEQVDLAVKQALERGMTTVPRLSRRLPKAWQGGLSATVADVPGLGGQVAGVVEDDGERYVSVAEVAELYDVTPQAVYKWIHTGVLAASERPGGSYQIAVSALQRDPRFDAGHARRLQYTLAHRHESEAEVSAADVVSQVRKRRTT
jgi:predicted transcriptional regulator of viral defense system